VVVSDSASMQGRSPVSEDRHVKISDLTKAARALKLPIDHLPQPCAFFGVYDGHRGNLCSEFMAKNFHTRLLKKLSDTSNCQWPNRRVGEAIQDVFADLDTEFMHKNRTVPDGCAACVSLVMGSLLFTAHVGDSRAVLCQKGADDSHLTIDITEDHRPTVQKEADRVKAVGGDIVEYAGGFRVAHKDFEKKEREQRKAEAQGMGKTGQEPQLVHLTRALGDRDFKGPSGKELITVKPDVRCIRLDPSHRFVALACAGISDVMANEEVIFELAFVRESLKASCASVVQEAFKRGSEENLTVILAKFEWPFTPGNSGRSSETGAEALKRKAREKEERAAKSSRTRGGKKSKIFMDEFILEAVKENAL